jgi:hypothetical protein
MVVKDNKAEILDIVKREGPILPAQLARAINTNILFASAILSQLVSKKELLITNVKRGGSPFYYVKGQEPKLEKLSEFLPGKLKEAYNLLKEKKVIRDKIAEPWQRVALRQIKDYAVPLNVSISGEYEIFWKYYLVSNEETKELIKNELGISDKTKKHEATSENFEATKKREEKPKEVLKKENLSIFDLVNSYFERNEIYVISQDIIRKNKEFNFVVDVPTTLGKLRYFVKVKIKKSINDKDLLNSWEEGNKRKLPVLFMTTGELSKKAQKFLNDNISGQFVFKKI